MARPNVKELIVEAGMKCLTERSFNGVGVQEITSAAGVPKGSFYNHFESKEALGVEIVERYGVTPRRAVLRDKSVPPLERLRRYFDATTKIFTDAKFERGCLLGNFSAELSGQSDVIRDSLVGLYFRWTEDFEIAIADAQEDGTLKTKTPAKELAAFLLDAYEGSLLRARVEKDVRPLDRFMDFAFKQLLI